jgi:uncharacterized protein (DUF2164 family)
MAIKLSKEAHEEAVASIQRYFDENMDDRIGNLAAGGLLDYFIEEIGPSIYNKAVVDVQEKLQAHIAELDVEMTKDEFQYWRKGQGKGRR